MDKSVSTNIKRERSKGKSNIVCALVQKCFECKRTVSNLKGHVCGYSVCINCNEYCDLQDNECYMNNVETKGGLCTRGGACENFKPKERCLCCKTRTDQYMFYDFETQQDTGVHIVNYVNDQHHR